MKHFFNTFSAVSAFIRTDAGLRGIGGEVFVAPLTIGSKLKH